MTIEIGSKVYYTGDMANASGWFQVTAADNSVYICTSYFLSEIDGDRKFFVMASQIGDVYRGHCNPRFVTEAAYNAFRSKR